MNKGIKTIIYPVQDLAAAKALYGSLLGVKPYMDEAWYVGYRVGDQEIGLDPNAGAQGLTMPVGYHQVDDIQARLKSLVAGGAQVLQDTRDVGGGKLIATARDADGNIIGLIQK